MKNSRWEDIYRKKGEAYHYYSIFSPHQDMKKVSAFFVKHNVKRILDLGCGAGRNLIFLAREGFDVDGLDSAPKGISLLKKKLKEEKLKAPLKVKSFFNHLPYPGEYFDAIISVQSLQHGKEKEIVSAIDEILRVLKPEGFVFITLCGRTSMGKVRLFLVKTAKRIDRNTYIPNQGDEKGLVHFIYNKQLIKKQFKKFKILEFWRDDKDYYCFIAKKK